MSVTGWASVTVAAASFLAGVGACASFVLPAPLEAIGSLMGFAANTGRAVAWVNAWNTGLRDVEKMSAVKEKRGSAMVAAASWVPKLRATESSRGFLLRSAMPPSVADS